MRLFTGQSHRFGVLGTYGSGLRELPIDQIVLSVEPEDLGTLAGDGTFTAGEKAQEGFLCALWPGLPPAKYPIAVDAMPKPTEPEPPKLSEIRIVPL